MSSTIQNTQLSPSSTIRTLYDETHRGIWHPELVIASMGNRPNLLGYLEHHAPTTDGSFSICFAGGAGVFIGEALYESIPLQHRPVLDTSEAGRDVQLILAGSTMKTLGSTFLPFIIITDTDEKVRMVLRVFVVKTLLLGMFWGMHGPFANNVAYSMSYGGDENPRGFGPVISFDFKNGQKYRFFGI